jgi:hypothetical protein
MVARHVGAVPACSVDSGVMAASPTGARQRAPSAEEELADRAARVRAMLARWSAIDTSDEPDWDLGDVGPLDLDDGRNEPDASSSR